MNIRYENNQYKIEPTLGRRIIKQFIDFETGHLIIHELESPQGGEKIYTTVFDRSTNKILSLNERQKMLDQQMKVIEEPPFRLTTVRTIDLLTGKELIEETLTNTQTKTLIAESQSTAFREKPRQNLMERHINELERRKREQEWFKNMSLDERKGQWFQGLYLAMRMQGEATGDEFAVFRPDSYRSWQKEEPEIEMILDLFIDGLSKLYGQEVKAEINQRLGRRV